MCERLTGLFLIAMLAGCSDAGAVARVAPPQPATTVATAATSDDNRSAAWPPVFFDSQGQRLQPADDPATKAIVLVFLLPDCPIANSYIPELNRLHEKFTEKGVLMLLVHVDPEVTLEQARTHASEYQIRSPVLLDPRHAWVEMSGVSVSPEAAVFSPAGQIVYRGRINDQYVGLGKRRSNITSQDLAEALEQVLAGKPVSQSRTEAIGCPIPRLTNSGAKSR
jgi:AhpC/TSA family